MMITCVGLLLIDTWMVNKKAEQEGLAAQQKLISIDKITPKQSSLPTPTDENALTDFKVIRVTDRAVEAEVWYFYTGDLGLENVLISPFVYDSEGEMLSVREAPGEVIVANRKAIARMEIHYDPLQEGDIKKSTEVQLCIMSPRKGWLHCQRFPYEKIWK